MGTVFVSTTLSLGPSERRPRGVRLRGSEGSYVHGRGVEDRRKEGTSWSESVRCPSEGRVFLRTVHSTTEVVVVVRDEQSQSRLLRDRSGVGTENPVAP